jgi:hypothetical protein
MRNTVEFVEYKSVSMWVPRPDRFEYAPKRGWAWLQRIAIAFLRWRGCTSHDETTTYTRRVIDPSDVLNKICAQHESLLRHFNREGERVLIGAETFAELMGGERMRSMFTFAATYRDGPQIMGMPITVVPWMTGVLVMPRIER